MRRIIGCLSDFHSGSRFGLLNPATCLLDDEAEEYHPSLTNTQAWFWERYQEALAATVSLANGAPITLIHDGDVCQGDRYGPLVSPLVVDQVAIAVANITPWLAHENVRDSYFITGTEAHDYGGGSAEQLVSLQLANDLGVTYTPHALLDFDGVTVDVAHHGPYPGSRLWLKGNVALLDLRDLMLGEIVRGQRPPDIYLRAHQHEPIDRMETIGDYRSRLLVTPAWQGIGQYVRSRKKSLPRICCGMVALEIEDGRLTGVHWFKAEKDLRRRIQA